MKSINSARKHVETIPSSKYILLGGDQGADRLRLLNNAYWPTTQILLNLAGLKEGSRFLDVGCGAGNMLMRVAHLLKNRAELLGIDKDERVIEIARTTATHSNIPADFRVVDIENQDLAEPSSFDFVYARSVLTHLKNPSKVISRMLKATQPGGTVIVEDIEFTGSFSHPECPAYYRFTELYQEAVKIRGADPNIGPRLYQMFRDAGVNDISVHVTQPTFFEGDGKKIAEVTMEHIRGAVVEAALATHGEVNAVIQELREFAASRETLLSFPRVFQLWGKK